MKRWDSNHDIFYYNYKGIHYRIENTKNDISNTKVSYMWIK